METAVGMLAFSALIGAQFLAVICVHNEHICNEVDGRHRHPTFDSRIWSMWVFG